LLFGPPCRTFGVGLADPKGPDTEDEDALALMRRADLRRREQSSLNLETQAL
jgi:hypothetical protein